MDRKSGSSSLIQYPSDDFLALFGVTPSIAGPDVSPFTAMRVPAVRAAVMAISEALGQIDAHVYSVGDGASQKAPDHPAYPLLHDAVNGWTSASEFREQVTRDACLHGNGYAAISRDSDGMPIELIRMQPERVAVLINPATTEPFYRYTPLDGVSVEYVHTDVIHLKTSSLNGILGESPVYQAREAIGLALVMEAHAARLFKNGARPSGALSIDKPVNPDGVEKIQALLRLQHSGSASGGNIILPHGTSFQQLSFSSTDAQFLEMRDLQIREIARVFRVNPILLGEMGRATFSNASEMGRQFLAYTLMPWVKRWQGEIALKLFAPTDRQKFRVEFDTDDFDRLDEGARATAAATWIAARVKSPNECRALEGDPPYPGGDAFLNPNITNVQETVNLRG